MKFFEQKINQETTNLSINKNDYSRNNLNIRSSLNSLYKNQLATNRETKNKSTLISSSDMFSNLLDENKEKKNQNSKNFSGRSRLSVEINHFLS